jgi:type VI secretion system secreted protein VgrG
MSDPMEIATELTIDGKAYALIRMKSHESLDHIDECHCELTDGADGPAPAPLVGKELVLTLTRASGEEERKFVGTVVEAEASTVQGEEVRGTRVVAKPRPYRLELRASSRVFQEMTAPDIIKKVLADADMPEADQTWNITGSYPTRAYTVQYRESDYAFVRRLCAEEGIAFTVDSSAGKDKVVFLDTSFDAITGEKELSYGHGDGLVATSDAITELRHDRRLVSGKAELRDYDFTRPKLKLESKAEAQDELGKALEVYAYPGRFTEPSNGDRLAQVLLDSIQARRELISGTTTTLRLHAGRTFVLVGHPYEPLNREYLVLEVDTLHEVTKPRGQDRAAASQSTFVAIPTEGTTYRPERIARAVASPGAQVAVTTGPAGMEIYPDEHGRVKVLFPWDREGKADDTSSLPIRTCQVPLGGSMLTPRVGWEVMLNFTDGDPDLPFVFGRMYNAEKPPPYPLPANKTRMAIQTATTPGGGSTNEVRMEDKAGSEEMFMNASKDASVSAGNNATESVGANETRSIGANQTLSVTDSMSSKVVGDQSLSVGGNQSINVGTYMVDEVGSHSLSIGGNRDLKAGGDHKRTVTGDSTLSVNGMQIDLVAGSSDEEGLDTMTDNVSAVLAELTASDRTVTVTGNRTESAAAAKVILSAGGRSVEVGGSLKQKVAGAILTKIKAGREDSSEGDFLEVAAGAQLTKATNVLFEAEDLLSVVMGASTITLTPASVSIAGTNITIDGECDETGALILDN